MLRGNKSEIKIRLRDIHRRARVAEIPGFRKLQSQAASVNMMATGLGKEGFLS
jgi:hypothetical protein